MGCIGFKMGWKNAEGLCEGKVSWQPSVLFLLFSLQILASLHTV